MSSADLSREHVYNDNLICKFCGIFEEYGTQKGYGNCPRYFQDAPISTDKELEQELYKIILENVTDQGVYELEGTDPESVKEAVRLITPIIESKVKEALRKEYPFYEYTSNMKPQSLQKLVNELQKRASLKELTTPEELKDK